MNQKNHWELMEPNESCTRFFDVEFSLAINNNHDRGKHSSHQNW